MIHHRFEKEMSLYLDHQLPERKARALEAHVKSCDSCRRVLTSLQGLLSELGELPKAQAPPWFREKLAARIGEIQDPSSERAARGKLPAKTAAALVGAAALALFFALFPWANLRIPVISVVLAGKAAAGEKPATPEVARRSEEKGPRIAEDRRGADDRTSDAETVSDAEALAGIDALVKSLDGSVIRRRQSAAKTSLLLEIPTERYPALASALRSFGTVEPPLLSRKRLASDRIRILVEISPGE